MKGKEIYQKDYPARRILSRNWLVIEGMGQRLEVVGRVHPLDTTGEAISRHSTFSNSLVSNRKTVYSPDKINLTIERLWSGFYWYWSPANHCWVVRIDMNCNWGVGPLKRGKRSDMNEFHPVSETRSWDLRCSTDSSKFSCWKRKTILRSTCKFFQFFKMSSDETGSSMSKNRYHNRLPSWITKDSLEISQTNNVELTGP